MEHPIVHTENLEVYRASLRDGLLNVALKFGAGVDKNGKPYEWMIESRELLLQGDYLHQAARLLWERIKPLDPQVVGGMTVAANPLTIAMMYESRAQGHPLDAVIIRREPKVDGLRKTVEGPDLRPGMRVVLLDDLINSGETQRQALAALQPLAVEVVAIGVVVDYERNGSKRLRDDGHRIESLFTFSDLGMMITPPSDPFRTTLEWQWGILNSSRNQIPKSTPKVHHDRIVVGSDNGFLLALSLEGKELWRLDVRDTTRGIHGTPACFDGRVYVGAYDGWLYCADLASGRKIWEKRPGQWIGSSPAVNEKDGLVYVGVEVGECTGFLSCAEASRGEIMWEMPTRHYIHASPIFDAPRGQVIVGCNDGSMYCADALTGRKRWEFATKGDIKAAAAIDDEGTCFFGSFDGHLYAIDAERGKLKWRKRLGRMLYTLPLIVDDLVVVGSYTSRVVAVDRRSGATRWVATTGARVVGGAARVSSAEIAIGSTDGSIYLLEAQTGRLLWTYRTGGPIMGVPGVGGGRLLVPSFDGQLYAFNMNDR